MKHLSLLVAIWLVPTGVMAQEFSVNFDPAPGFVAPLSTIGSGDHAPSTTETSPANARSIRRGGRSVVVTENLKPAESRSAGSTRMANAGS
jgi:hypothetical protein